MDQPVATRSSAARFTRSIVRQIHLWLGLSAGLILALVGASGAALVFAEPLVKWQAPQLFQQSNPAEWRPVSEWIASAEQKNPDLAPLRYVYGPGTIPMPTGVPIIFTLSEVNGSERHTLIPIDPVKGVALDRIHAEDTWAGLLVIFHKELLAHDIGIMLVAIAGIVGVISVATGIYLWWPRAGRWGFAFRLRRGARGAALLYDLHSVPAAWLLLPLAIALLSGLYAQKPGWIDPIVRVASDIREPTAAQLTSSAANTCPSPTTVDEAIAIAKKGREDQVLRLLWMPRTPTGAIKVELRKPDTNSRAEGTEVYVDRNCPRVLHVSAVEDMTVGEVMKGWRWPVHTDLLLGVFGQALLFLAGLSLPALFVTGLMYWLKTRRA
jgi:uncharacterized iron-regulated membrane protein